MKGLILKEFYIKYDILNFIWTSIILLILYKVFNVIFTDLIIAFTYFIMFVCTYQKYEMLNDKNSFNMYLKILPINSNKIILSKYLFIIFISLIILFICFIYSLFVNESTEILNRIKYYFGYLFFINFTIIYFSISYLVFIFFKESLIANIISTCIALSFSLLINGLIIKLIFDIFTKITNSNAQITGEPIFLIPSLINTFISSIIAYFIYKITCLKYKKIEL